MFCDAICNIELPIFLYDVLLPAYGKKSVFTAEKII